MSYDAIDDSGRKVRLRKRKWCEWCGEWIEVGEEAVVRVYKWDGSFTDARQHPECFDAMQDYAADNWYGEFDPGQMLRGDSRHPDDVPSEEWERLHPPPQEDAP